MTHTSTKESYYYVEQTKEIMVSNGVTSFSLGPLRCTVDILSQRAVEIQCNNIVIIKKIAMEYVAQLQPVDFVLFTFAVH